MPMRDACASAASAPPRRRRPAPVDAERSRAWRATWAAASTALTTVSAELSSSASTAFAAACFSASRCFRRSSTNAAMDLWDGAPHVKHGRLRSLSLCIFVRWKSSMHSKWNECRHGRLLTCLRCSIGCPHIAQAPVGPWGGAMLEGRRSNPAPPPATGAATACALGVQLPPWLAERLGARDRRTSSEVGARPRAGGSMSRGPASWPSLAPTPPELHWATAAAEARRSASRAAIIFRRLARGLHTTQGSPTARFRH